VWEGMNGCFCEPKSQRDLVGTRQLLLGALSVCTPALSLSPGGRDLSSIPSSVGIFCCSSVFDFVTLHHSTDDLQTPVSQVILQIIRYSDSARPRNPSFTESNPKLPKAKGRRTACSPALPGAADLGGWRFASVLWPWC
jgi:hypothetical protein